MISRRTYANADAFRFNHNAIWPGHDKWNQQTSKMTETSDVSSKPYMANEAQSYRVLKPMDAFAKLSDVCLGIHVSLVSQTSMIPSNLNFQKQRQKSKCLQHALDAISSRVLFGDIRTSVATLSSQLLCLLLHCCDSVSKG
jgi:hypothetical protein